MSLKPGDQVIFEDNGFIHKVWVLWLNENGSIQVSENKTIETMGMAQNWIILPLQVKSLV